MLESIVQWDFSVLNFIKEHLNCGFMDFAMKWTSILGGAVIWLVIGIVFIFIKKYRKDGINLIFCFGICVLLIECAIKLLIMRERPYIIAEIPIIVAPPMGTSFPSGHTSLSFAAASALMTTDKRFGIPAYIFAAFVGFSRLYLYVHFPTDIIAGAIFGTVFGLVFSHFFKKLLNKIPILNK